MKDDKSSSRSYSQNSLLPTATEAMAISTSGAMASTLFEGGNVHISTLVISERAADLFNDGGAHDKALPNDRGAPALHVE
jgi:hypothetical protein